MHDINFTRCHVKRLWQRINSGYPLVMFSLGEGETAPPAVPLSRRSLLYLLLLWLGPFISRQSKSRRIRLEAKRCSREKRNGLPRSLFVVLLCLAHGHHHDLSPLETICVLHWKRERERVTQVWKQSCQKRRNIISVFYRIVFPRSMPTM